MSRANPTSRLILALHGSASSARQWRALKEELATEFRIEAPDLNGYGSTSCSQRDALPGLARRAAPLIDQIAFEQAPVHLVGHSFGGALAFKIAAMRPDLVASVTVYEPALLSLLRESPIAGDRQCYQTFLAAGAKMTAGFASGASGAAMQPVIEFWNGQGAWDTLDPNRKAALTSRTSSTLRDFIDVSSDRMSADEVKSIRAPVSVISGEASTEAGKRIARRLENLLPGAQSTVLLDADHMSPITEPNRLNALIKEHLSEIAVHQQSQSWAA